MIENRGYVPRAVLRILPGGDGEHLSTTYFPMENAHAIPRLLGI